MTKTTTRIAALTGAIAAALFVSACTTPAGDGHADHQHDTSASAAAPADQNAADHNADHNAADVNFATMMIPHHQQAVQMSGLVPSRSSDPAVVDLAAAIAKAQGPEIETMQGFLAKWNGGQAPATGHDGHDMSDMQGMVDSATMDRLETLEGRDFDTLWLQSMIGHHEGAIAMANTEIAGGANADAKTLAQEIVTGQQAEITQMKQMLGG
jgi:uncharacterized protein (DUF305 family)